MSNVFVTWTAAEPWNPESSKSPAKRSRTFQIERLRRKRGVRLSPLGIAAHRPYSFSFCPLRCVE